MLVLLPVDPDASAAAIRERIGELTGRDVGVIVSDSFGRPFRTGIVDVAIGVAGISPLTDWRGQVDPAGHELQHDGDSRRGRDRLGRGARHGQARRRAGRGRPRARGARPGLRAGTRHAARTEPLYVGEAHQLAWCLRRWAKAGFARREPEPVRAVRTVKERANGGTMGFPVTSLYLASAQCR